MEVGRQIEIYTLIMRGMSQNSYNGSITEVSPNGVTIKMTSMTVFFPWSSIERIIIKT